MSPICGPPPCTTTGLIAVCSISTMSRAKLCAIASLPIAWPPYFTTTISSSYCCMCGSASIRMRAWSCGATVIVRSRVVCGPLLAGEGDRGKRPRRAQDATRSAPRPCARSARRGPAGPMLCALTRAPSSSRNSSSASISGSAMPMAPHRPTSRSRCSPLNCSITHFAGWSFSGNSIAALASAQPRWSASSRCACIDLSQPAVARAGRPDAPPQARPRTCRPRRRAVADIRPPARPWTRSAGRASSCWCRRPRRSPRPRPPGCPAGKTGPRRPPECARAAEFANLQWWKRDLQQQTSNFALTGVLPVSNKHICDRSVTRQRPKVTDRFMHRTPGRGHRNQKGPEP